MVELLNKHGFSVRAIADSIAYGTRITTLELVYPRFIHAEVMTHRMFSRNASSSRAIPVKRMLENCTAMPIHWGANKAGMSASEECTVLISKGVHGEDLTREAVWEHAKEDAVISATLLSDAGYHKQVVNRLTEPFQFIKVIVTATEWDNFFELRDSEAAQPEIRELAQMMKSVMADSEPKEFDENDWHVPYYHQGFWQDAGEGLDLLGNTLQVAQITSAAGCARVSYDNHDGSAPDIEKDTKLFGFLKEEKHMTPFEHQAMPMGLAAIAISDELEITFAEGVTSLSNTGEYWSANFKNWVQMRQMRSFYGS